MSNTPIVEPVTAAIEGVLRQRIGGETDFPIREHLARVLEGCLLYTSPSPRD